MKLKLRPQLLTPSIFELVGGMFLTLAIIVLANSKKLLSYYGLGSSDQFIQSSASKTINDALKSIDSISATNSVVTFLIWAVVGVVCFVIVETLERAYRELQFENALSSKRYIHPATFTKAKFWQGVLVDTITLALGLVLLTATVLLVVLFAVPLGLAYSRVFLFDANAMNALYMLLGLFVIYASIFVLNIVIRLLLHRRRIFSI